MSERRQSEASDRRVHATYRGMEIVRYDRSGKWWLEPTDRTLGRQPVSVRAAASLARWGRQYADGAINFGLPGGKAFDRIVRHDDAR